MPELRFAGFSGEWEEKKIKNISTINSGKDYKHLQSGDIPVYGTGGLMTHVNEYLSEKDSIGIGRKGTINRPYILNHPFWTVDTLFFTTPNIETNLYFLYGIYQNINWLKYDESSGLPSLSKKNIENLVVSVPNIKEQEKIGDLFSKIDQLIEGQQEIVDQTMAFKKSMLQKMFPTKNNPIPKFRFREFTDNYKNISLLNVGENLKGTNYSKKDLIDEDESVEFIPYGMIFTDYKPIISESSYKVKEKNNSVKSRIGDLIFPSSSTTSDNEIVSASAVSKEGIIYGGDINIIRINDLDLAIYLSYYITSTELKNRIFRNVQGTTIHHLYFSSLKNINIWLPTTEEQRAVNRIFLNLDNKIKESEKLLDAYKDMKKSLLQKMFV